MKNYRDAEWNLDDCETTMQSASLAVLMDIRRELKRLNQLLHCANFQAMPRKLDRIIENTRKPKKRKIVVKTDVRQRTVSN